MFASNTASEKIGRGSRNAILLADTRVGRQQLLEPPPLPSMQTAKRTPNSIPPSFKRSEGLLLFSGINSKLIYYTEKAWCSVEKIALEQTVQRSKKWLVHGLVKFATAVARLVCPDLLG